MDTKRAQHVPGPGTQEYDGSAPELLEAAKAALIQLLEYECGAGPLHYLNPGTCELSRGHRGEHFGGSGAVSRLRAAIAKAEGR